MASGVGHLQGHWCRPACGRHRGSGIDVYLAGLVHRPEELPEQEARAVVIARTCRAFVVFASFAGPTGDGFNETAGSSAIWSPDGLTVVRAGPELGGIVRATLPWSGRAVS